MKKTLIASLILLAGYQTSSFSDEEAEVGANHPCKNVAAACKAAGFHKGGHKENKGLWKDCIIPAMKGGTVTGVTISPTDIEACKKHRERK